MSVFSHPVLSPTKPCSQAQGGLVGQMSLTALFCSLLQSRVAVNCAQVPKPRDAISPTQFKQNYRTIAAVARPFDEEMDLDTAIGNPADKVLHLIMCGTMSDQLLVL